MISKHTNEDQKKEDQNTINTYINILTALYNLIISKENENTVLINFDVFSINDWKTFYFVMSDFLHYLYNSDYNDPQTENATVAGFPTLLKYLKIFEKICMAITPEAKKIRVYWMDFEDEPTIQQRTNSLRSYNIQETLYALIENYTNDDLKSLIEDSNGQDMEDAWVFVDYIKQQK
ncbi:MAG: hypothetical protein H6772_02830 [Pseudomonadales bacterium]|nr:hypothetical protein [Pseudomonadales bacterium]